MGDRGVGCVDDVQVMSEGLGPILERMRRGVGGHVTAGIPGRSAARVVGLGEVQGHDTVEVTGDAPLTRDVHEIEHEPIGCWRRSHLERKSERVQLMDEATLRCFGLHPRLDNVGSSTVGATTGQPAGTTPHGVGTGCQHPVATPRRVQATPPPPVAPDDLVRRRIVRWQQQPDRSILAHVSERGTTCSALLHGKRHPMVTSAATEDAHLSGPMPLRCRSSRSPIK